MDEESESLAPPLTSITSLLTPQIASPISILSTEFEYLLPQYKELDTYPPSPFKISTSVPSVAEELNELNEGKPPQYIISKSILKSVSSARRKPRG
jgi:hypothetical protein